MLLLTIYLLVSVQEFGHQPPDWLKEIASSSGIESKRQSWTKVFGQSWTFAHTRHKYYFTSLTSSPPLIQC